MSLHDPLREYDVAVIVEEREDHTDAKATVTVRGTQFGGWGRARRHPLDPEMPSVGDELAIARALAELSRHLLGAAADAIEDREGRPVTLHL